MDADATAAPSSLAVPAKQSFAPKTPGTVNAPTGGAPAPSATMSAPAPAPPVNTEWKPNLADGTVRTVLARWANEVGWQFIRALEEGGDFDDVFPVSEGQNGEFHYTMHYRPRATPAVADARSGAGTAPSPRVPEAQP